MAPNGNWETTLTDALMKLSQLIHEDGVVSAYEMHSSGLVQALVAVLSVNHWETNSPRCKRNKMQKQRVSVFKKCILEDNVESATNKPRTKSTASILIQNLSRFWKAPRSCQSICTILHALDTVCKFCRKDFVSVWSVQSAKALYSIDRDELLKWNHWQRLDNFPNIY